jgi:hypothetical protein
MPAARLSGPCASLYAALVPWDIRVLLQQTREPGARLNIHAQAAFDWIPWELLFDPELQAFLGLHFQISRLPIVTKPPVAATQPRVVRHIHNVLGKKVLDQAGDAALFDKWVTTFAQVDPSNVTCIPSGHAAAYVGVEVLQEAVSSDILHVTCHGMRNDALGNFWTLDKDASTYVGAISSEAIGVLPLTNGRPLVFGNACFSAAAATGMSSGLGPAFFRRGALNLIGTLAPVSKTLAIDFARKFYADLFGSPGNGGPHAIGEALLSAKNSFHAAAGGDPSYLLYCLYGPADTCFILTRD